MNLPRHWLLALGGIVIIAALLAAFALAEPQATEVETQPLPNSEESSVESEVNDPAAVPSTVVVQAPQPQAALMKSAAEATAVLIVDGARLPVFAPIGATLKIAMDQLEAEGSLSYSSREYGGLGAFVTEINGRTGEDQVWILYVNGEKSSTGISATRIRSADTFEWKLEHSY